MPATEAILKPVRPGTIITYVGETIAALPPTFAETIAVPGTHDWGPENAATLVRSYPEFLATFGSTDTQLRRAVQGAFVGQGLGGAGGAGAVEVYRLVGSAGAKAAVTLQNSTPANALTLTARYSGAKGNSLSVAVTVHPTLAATKILSLYLNGALVEQFVFAQTAIDALAADLNARSGYVTAASLITGVALGTVATPAPLTGGNSGTSTVGGDWSTMLTRLQTTSFSVLAANDLVDPTILATVAAWVASRNEANAPVFGFAGGASTDTMSAAITRSQSLASEHWVNLGVGAYHDGFANADLSTAQLTARVAGVFVARGEEKALTFAKLAALEVAAGSAGPTDQEIKDGIQNGVTTFSLASGGDATLKVEKGVTTYTSTTDASKPLDVFGDPRLVRVLDLYVAGMKEWGDEIVIGDLPVNDETRAVVYAEAKRRQDDLQRRGLIIPGTGVVVVPVPTDPNLLDSIPYNFGWQFARTANYIFGRGKVR